MVGGATGHLSTFLQYVGTIRSVIAFFNIMLFMTAQKVIQQISLLFCVTSYCMHGCFFYLSPDDTTSYISK